MGSCPESPSAKSSASSIPSFVPSSRHGPPRQDRGQDPRESSFPLLRRHRLRSRIVFKTAGVLLEQMRDKGDLALNYKVIILDEVHERSVESDLVLACVKQFMAKITDLRVVLMSATADISRYKDYFSDIGRGERVEVIAIPSNSHNSIFQRNVLYLEKDKHRLHHLKHILKVDETKTPHSMIPKLEEEWCLRINNLVQTSLHNVSEIYDDIINTMHRFRPVFFAVNNFDLCTFKHKCLLQSDLPEEMEGLQLDEENMDSVIDTKRCVTEHYIAPNNFHVVMVAERLKALIREGCRFGDKCFSSPDYGPTAASIISRIADKCFYSPDYACLQEGKLFLRFLQEEAIYGYVLIMNDKDLSFSTFLSCNFDDPTKIFVSISDPYSPDIEASLPDVTLLWDVRHPHQLFIENRVPSIPWGEVCFVLLFADIGSDDDSRVQQLMMQNFFELLAICVLADTLFRLQVIVTMNNIRFTRLQLLYYELIVFAFSFFISRKIGTRIVFLSDTFLSV